MARIGDILGIRKRIKELEALAPEFAPFLGEIHKLAKDLKIVKIQEFIAQFMEKEEQHAKRPNSGR